MTYAQWEAEVPQQIKQDTVWRVEAYRLGLFLADLAWVDCAALRRDKRTIEIAEQLMRSTDRISVSVAEGYSRDTGRARSTFYEYALGSARESRDWYYKSRRVLKPQVVEHRLDLCTQIIRLTPKMVATERRVNRRVSEVG